MPRTILAVAQAAEPGGAEYGLLRIAPHLAARGFHVHLTVPTEGRVAELARAQGLPVDLLPVGPLAGGGWPRAVRSWPRARRLVRDTGAQLAYLNGTVAQRLSPALQGVPQVVHLHDLLDHRPLPWRAPGFWRSVRAMPCDSRAVADRARALGAPAERLHTVHCPVEAPDPAPRPAWTGADPVVGYVGRIEPRKGTLDLLDAAPALFEAHPDVRIVIAGEAELDADEHYAARVRTRARDLGERVIMLGRVESAARLMPWFDVLAVPSLAEPFGTVAAEALAAGTPVVATRSGGMEEYVVPGVCGQLIEPGNPAALAEAVLTLLEHGAAMASAAREAASPFAVERVAGAVADVFDLALERT